MTEQVPSKERLAELIEDRQRFVTFLEVGDGDPDLADALNMARDMVTALKQLQSTHEPATAQMSLSRAHEIAEDIAEAMRITSRGEWVIDLVGGPFTADQLEAIAVIMRDEASETKAGE